MLLPLHFQLDLWRRWPADFDDVPDGKGGLDRNPLGICTRSSDPPEKLIDAPIRGILRGSQRRG